MYNSKSDIYLNLIKHSISKPSIPAVTQKDSLILYFIKYQKISSMLIITLIGKTLIQGENKISRNQQWGGKVSDKYKMVGGKGLTKKRKNTWFFYCLEHKADADMELLAKLQLIESLICLFPSLIFVPFQ